MISKKKLSFVTYMKCCIVDVLVEFVKTEEYIRPV